MCGGGVCIGPACRARGRAPYAAGPRERVRARADRMPARGLPLRAPRGSSHAARAPPAGPTWRDAPAIPVPGRLVARRTHR